MAFEPKIEHFMQELVREEGNILGNNREETLWYLEETQIPVVVQEFDKLSEEEQHIAVNNLARIYPLSKNMLHYFLVRLTKGDHDFIMGLDLLDILIPDLQKTLRWVKEQMGNTTEQFSNCIDELECLRRERQELQDETEKYQEYREMKAKLKSEIDKLRKENDSVEREKTLEKLKQKKYRLDAQIKEKKAAEDKGRKILEQLKKDLQQLDEENRMMEPIQSELRTLLEKFPEDAENRK